MMQESPREGGHPATGEGHDDLSTDVRREISTEELLRIAGEFRKAARRLADDATLTVRAKCLALLDLNRRARREVLPEFAEAAVWGGSRHMFVEDRSVPRDLIEACRRLLRRGPDCPTCRRPLPSHEDLDRWVELGQRSMIRRGAA